MCYSIINIIFCFQRLINKGLITNLDRDKLRLNIQII